MPSYTLAQWEIFFLIYAFIGWIYEEIFYLVTDKKLVNRGFMHGPVLPIYGAGAVIILLAVMPFSTNPVLVFIVGGAVCTVLEYFTGDAMERLFHVRYWDYTNCFMNFRGHICFRATLTWCIASVLLVNLVQIPLANIICGINTSVINALSNISMLCFAADFALSFREAMDLRKLLDTLTEQNEEIARLVTEFNARKAEAEAEMARRKTELEAEISRKKAELETEIAQRKAEFERARETAEYNIEKIKFNAESDMEHMMFSAEERAKRIREQAEERWAHAMEKLDPENKLGKLREKLEAQKTEFNAEMRRFKKSVGYGRIKAIIKRNHVVATQRYKKALEDIKNLM